MIHRVFLHLVCVPLPCHTRWAPAGKFLRPGFANNLEGALDSSNMLLKTVTRMLSPSTYQNVPVEVPSTMVCNNAFASAFPLALVPFVQTPMHECDFLIGCMQGDQSRGCIPEAAAIKSKPQGTRNCRQT